MAPKPKDRPRILTVYALVTVSSHAVFGGRSCELSYGDDDGAIVVKEKGRTFVFPRGTCAYEVES